MGFLMVVSVSLMEECFYVLSFKRNSANPYLWIWSSHKLYHGVCLHSSHLPSMDSRLHQKVPKYRSNFLHFCWPQFMIQTA